jgi:hypothetical protein
LLGTRGKGTVGVLLGTMNHIPALGSPTFGFASPSKTAKSSFPSPSKIAGHTIENSFPKCAHGELARENLVGWR